jgi:predicted O-methyltransferase YrrM
LQRTSTCLVTDKLTDRAVVVTDNITTHETQLAEFIAWIRQHDGFCSAGVPVGNGMELSIKRAGRKHS